MGDKPESKWAVEAFDFLRLFRRVGRSFVGLLFLAIGWTLYMILVGKVVGEQPNPYVIDVPLPARVPAQAPLTVPLTLPTFYLVGLFLLLLGWGVYSGFYRYVSAPFGLIIKPVVVALLLLGFVPALLLTLVLLPITLPLERYL